MCESAFRAEENGFPETGNLAHEKHVGVATPVPHFNFHPGTLDLIVVQTALLFTLHIQDRQWRPKQRCHFAFVFLFFFFFKATFTYAEGLPPLPHTPLITG